MAVVPNTGQRALDDAAAALAGAYAEAEQALQAQLAAQVAAGLDQDPADVLRAIQLGELRAAARRAVDRLRRMTESEIAALLGRARKDGAIAAVRELDGTLAATGPVVQTAPAIAALQVEIAGVLTAGVERILRWPDDVYRRAVAEAATGNLLRTYGTSREAQAAAWQRLIAQDVSTFVDRAGRRWNLASYSEMATRTAVRRAYDAQHRATMAAAGLTLVTVVVGSEACQACARWAGQVLDTSAGGQVGWREEPSLLAADEMVRVYVAGTVDQATDQGWHHPNCRCRLVAYIPGRAVAGADTTYDPEAEAARARLRALERRVRAAKTAEASAVTPEQAARARVRVRAAQADIRKHVDATGVTRQRNREQVNLGFRT